ncbi:hypothetical protein SAMN05428947_102107 [Mucilaginibacter sp. OK283]|nr:hypothetical protein SAMN05428947_102107 [Mucilaginibacter sp. OK283]
MLTQLDAFAQGVIGLSTLLQYFRYDGSCQFQNMYKADISYLKRTPR